MVQRTHAKRGTWKKLLSFCLVVSILLCFSYVMPTVVNAATSELRVVGNKIYNAYDETVRLTGVNIPGMEWNPGGEYTLKNAVEALDHWNATVIRIPLNQEFWFGYNNNAVQNEDLAAKYKELVSAIVKLAAARNKYVIFDLHWSDNGGHGMNVGQQPMPNDYSLEFWQQVCAIYKNNPTVLFGLYNEPFNVTWDIWQNGGTITHNGITYETPGFQKMIEAVRDTGAKNICIIGGADWGYDLTGVLTHQLLDKNTDGTFTGNGIMFDSHIYPWKWENQWNTANPADSKVSCIKDSYPVLIGECGWDDPNWARENPEFGPDWHAEPHAIWSPKLLDWIDANGYNWTAWSFHTGAAPVLISDWDYTPSPQWGAYVKPRLQEYPSIQPTGVFGNLVPQSQMIVTSGNEQPGNEIGKAADGNRDTFWSSSWSSYQPLSTSPVSVTINLGNVYNVNEIRYLPRHDQGNMPNGAITDYKVYTSTDGVNFTNLVSQGTWESNAQEKLAKIQPVSSSYIRLEALDGSLGLVAAAEINVGYIKYVSNVTATADSEQSGHEAGSAVDGSSSTFWAGSESVSITLELDNTYGVNEIRYLPRQDQGNSPYGAITEFSVYVSTDNSNWKKLIDHGQLASDEAEKHITFEPMNAKYVRLTAFQGNNDLVAAAEIKVGYAEELVSTPPAPITEPPMLVPIAIPLPQALITVTPDNGQTGHEASLAVDGESGTYWQNIWNPNIPLESAPVSITLDLGSVNAVTEIRYLPRQDQGNTPNGTITKYNLYVSTDGVYFNKIVNQGIWELSSAEKSAVFPSVSGRYVRLEALEGYLNMAGAAEINVGCDNFVPQEQIRVTTDNEQAGEGASKAVDGNRNSFWHSSWNPYKPIPASITLDLGTVYDVNLIKYLPRQDQADMPNGAITKYNLFVSTDGTNFTKVVDQGQWLLNELEKFAAFNMASARYLRLEALEGYKDLAVAAEINVGYVPKETYVEHAKMTATSNNEQPGDGAWKAVDGNSGSFWHSSWDPAKPVSSSPTSITISLGDIYDINEIKYLPRQDQEDAPNGAITRYNLYVSSDGISFTKVVDQGQWALSKVEKTVAFGKVSANHIKLEVLEGFKDLAVASEINVGYEQEIQVVPQNPDIIPQSQMTITPEGIHPGMDPNKALDGDTGSFIESKWSDPKVSVSANKPSIILSLGDIYKVNELKYLPRQDQGNPVGGPNGAITGYNLFVSTDGTDYTEVVHGGAWVADNTEKTAEFTAITARYIKLQVTAGVIDMYGIAELNVGTATGNEPPVLSAVASKSASEGLNLSFSVSAIDPDNDVLTYNADTLPAGAIFNVDTGIFSWTPGYSQAGDYSLRFYVSDGTFTDYEDVAITVKNVMSKEMTASLVTYVKSINISKISKNLLVKQLENIASSLNKGLYKLALVKMKVFMTAVKVLEPKIISKVQANEILKASLDICMAIKADAQGKDKNWVDKKADELIERLKVFRSKAITDKTYDDMMKVIDELSAKIK